MITFPETFLDNAFPFASPCSSVRGKREPSCASSGSSSCLGIAGSASVLRPAACCWPGIQVQILPHLPGAHLNSLAPMKSGRLNVVQTSRLLLEFKNLLKILLAILLYCYHKFCLYILPLPIS